MNQTVGYSGGSAIPRNFIGKNIFLWKNLFWDTWNPLPLDVKLTWLAFVSQTIAVITTIELLFIKR